MRKADAYKKSMSAKTGELICQEFTSTYSKMIYSKEQL